MPAKDHYHDAVKRALIKDGWHILDENYFIGTETRQLWVDLHIENGAGEKRALVEIKSFSGQSVIEDLANAIGKYLIYRAALIATQTQVLLYLAIPSCTHRQIFSESLGLVLRRMIPLHLIVYDIAGEVING